MKRRNSSFNHNESQEITKRRVSSAHNESHYEEIEHPNEVNEDSSDEEYDPNEPASWAKSRFVRWFGQFDENVLRPCFIRRYNRARAMLEDEYQELLREAVDEESDEDIADKVDALTVISKHPRT